MNITPRAGFPRENIIDDVFRRESDTTMGEFFALVGSSWVKKEEYNIHIANAIRASPRLSLEDWTMRVKTGGVEPQ